MFCSVECLNKCNATREKTCEYCGKGYIPKWGSQQRFCSKRCSNIAIVRRAKSTRVGRNSCETCGVKTDNAKFCSNKCKAVYMQKDPLAVFNEFATVNDYYEYYGALAIHKVRSRIGDNARSVLGKINKDKKCAICGYDKHVQVHHIKGIGSFGRDALVSEINKVDNLVYLCPNHHWEVERGLIKLDR